MNYFGITKFLLTTSAIWGGVVAFSTGAYADTAQVTNWTEFKSAANAGKDIVLMNNITATDVYTINKDLKISGNDGNTFVISPNGTITKSLLTLKSGKKLELLGVKISGFQGITKGGVIQNGGTISTVENVVFDSNKSKGKGTAISNDKNSKIGTIRNSVFSNNVSEDKGGAIHSEKNVTIDAIYDSEFSSNQSKKGGAINNGDSVKIDIISGTKFVNNKSTGSGGALFNDKNANIGSIVNSEFTGNQAEDGGAIRNDGTIGKISADFSQNSSTVHGGAIYNDKGKITEITGNKFYANSSLDNGGAIYNKNIISKVSSNFVSNHSDKKGGAIYNEKEINFYADAADNELLDEIRFSGNTIAGDLNEAIYSKGTLTFHADNGGVFSFDDYINNDGGKLEFYSADNAGTLNLYNNIKDDGKKGSIKFADNYAIDMINSTINAISSKTLTIDSVISMNVDVDLKNAKMDNFIAKTANGTGSINIANMNILSQTFEPKTIISFIDAETNSVVVNSDISRIQAENFMHYYDVSYADGNFTFSRKVRDTNKTSQELGITSIHSGIQLLNNSINTHVLGRVVSPFEGLASGDEMQPKTWAKAFGSKDSVELKHFDAIDAQFYGVIGGVDSKKFTYDNGISSVYGVYAAYMGSRQKYEDNKVSQDGGYLGLYANLRLLSLFSNFALNGGYIANTARTVYGDDKFDMYTTNISNKTGYDIAFGEYVLTPSIYASYMYINTEDYTSKAGAKISSASKNVLEITPEVKLAKDFGAGLDGYAKIAYTWNFYHGGKVTADDVLLPKLSVKPYVEYGIGVEKDWSEEEWNPKNITSFAEINRHDGGREGWDANAGLKYQF